MALTNPKHESFCQAWHETGNKTEAYRQSHPNAAKWKDATINKRASELSLQGEISGRLKELQNDALKSHGITITSLLTELDAIKAVAMEADTPQCSAATSCVMNKAKLVGLDIHKVENTIKVEAIDDFNDC